MKSKSAIETITPKIAEELLKKNTMDRNLRERRVKSLVHIILNGEWEVNGEAIKIANDGTLLDGQHRLCAVVMAKKPIMSYVVRGLPPESRATMDLGTPRNFGNHLQMQGYKGSVFAIAAAVGICLAFNGTGIYHQKKERMTPKQMLTYLKANKPLLKGADIYTSAEYKDFRDMLPQSTSIALWYLFTNINQDKGEEFFHKLVKGNNLGDKSPILKLRTELIAMRKETKRGYTSRHAFLFYMCSAYQAFLDDKRIDRLPEYRREGKVILPKASK